MELRSLAVEVDGALTVELDAEEDTALDLSNVEGVGAVRLSPPPVRLIPVAVVCDV